MSYIGPNGQKQSENIHPRMKDNITVAPLPQINPAKPATMAFAYVIVVNARVPDERIFPTVGTAVTGYLKATGQPWTDWEHDGPSDRP